MHAQLIVWAGLDSQWNGDMVSMQGEQTAHDCAGLVIVEVLAMWKEQGRRNHRGQRQKW
jgi:hypothetical protein